MITKRQTQVLNFIKSFQVKRGFSPSLEEVKKHLKLSSVSTAHHHVKALEGLGYLKTGNHQPRAINIYETEQMISIPLLGTIAAGQPIVAVREKETIAVSQSKLTNENQNIFALRVAGNSMIDENINDGDIILVKQQNTAENGQKVVVLIDNSETTLKRFYKEKNQIRLQPANKNIEPIILRKDRDLKIQGVFLSVIKSRMEKTEEEQNISESEEAIAKSDYIKGSNTKRIIVNKLNDLQASEWIPETVSVYVQKGLGRGHEDTKIEIQHPAPYSFQDVGRLIRFFTKKGQKVLDPFVGVGSTLKACAIDGREGVGIELVKKYADLSKQRLEKEVQANLFSNVLQRIILGDALMEVEKMRDDEFDFIVTSPPYWNILTKKADHKVKQERVAHKLDTKYSDDKRDLGNIDSYDHFVNVLSNFFNSCSRILKPKKYLAIVVSDFRNKDKYHMFHSDLASKLEAGNFALKGITILYQRHKKIFPYGYPYAYVPNIHHQYILILQNKKNVN